MADNLSDALIMAGAILIFVIALTASMSSFTTMRSQIDEIIEYDSKLDLVTDESGNYLNYHTSDSDVREVGIETVVSSMYRVAKENYIVYIAGFSSTDKDDIDTGNVKLDTLQGKSNKNEAQYYDFNKNGSFEDNERIIKKNEPIIEISINGYNSDIDTVLGKKGVSEIGKKTLYSILKDKRFKEYLGVYQENTNEDVDEINKTTYRVITYVIQ